MDKLIENDSRKYVCDDCINNCKKKATGCSEWKKNTLENKYARILYMGVGRSGLTDENSIISKAISKQVELKTDLEAKIHRLENLILEKTTSDEEKIKVLVSLECYSRILNQLNN